MVFLGVLALVLTLVVVSATPGDPEVILSHIDVIGYGPRTTHEISLSPLSQLYPFFHQQVINKYAPFTLYDLYELPFYYMVKTTTKPDHYMMYYARHGVRSTYENEFFKPLFEYLKTPVEKTGVFFKPKFASNTKLFDLYIDNVVYPDNFTMEEFVDYSQGEQLPILLVNDNTHELGLELKPTYNIASLKMYNNYIDIVVAHEEHKPKQEKVTKVVNISDGSSKLPA